MKNEKKTLSPADCFLFDALSPRDRAAAIRSLPPPTPFEKGATIDVPRASGGALGILLSGSARVKRTGAGGKEQTCNRLVVGDAFGAATLFSEEAAASAVTAEKNCIVQFVPEKVLISLIHTFPRVGENLARFLADRIRFLNRSLNGLRGGTAADRLLAHLRTLADGRGTLTLPPLSALAAKLDMGRTSIYRALDELEQSGALTKTGKTVTLSRSL